MSNETDKIFEEQLEKLPTEVVNFITSTDWDTDVDEIGSLYSLSEEKLEAFNQEVTLVLAGLVHPDEFKDSLEQEVGIEGTVLEAIVANVEKKIFAPIRPALIEFFEKEAKENTEEVPVEATTAEKPRMQMPDVAPDNLPTDEGDEPLLPPIPSKFGKEAEEIPAHPFEEKMKKVFTAGQQSLGDLAIEPPSQTPSPTQAPKAPPISHADPYREAIE